MEYHPHEVKLLKALTEKSTAFDLASKADLPLDTILRAGSWLATKNLVKAEESFVKEITLDKEGLLYAKEGLPERQIISVIKSKANLGEIKKKFKPNVFAVGLGWLRKKNMASLANGELAVLDSSETSDEKLIKLLEEKNIVDLSELSEELLKAFEQLNSRQNVIKLTEKRIISFNPTKKGLELAETLEVKDSISHLTPDIILSKKWREKEFRPYDASVYIKPSYPAKKHPLQVAMSNIRDIFTRMGFKEISGSLTESSFWNFDALFTAQDHPARDLHDTFYLKEPSSVDIPKFSKLKSIVKATHENGGDTGSTGWQYKWSEQEARKSLLRTHTTALTAKYLSGLTKDDLPSKVFSIGKVFRNEAVDYKHLPEFYQVEGIIVDENANFRNLLGILKRFYDGMGFKKIRFRPGYFPYTEMSVEPEVYFEAKGEWMELGGAGIFRPEVVKPLLGFDCPVLAWGLGLDRVVALSLGLTDIRELYLSNLSTLRAARI